MMTFFMQKTIFFFKLQCSDIFHSLNSAGKGKKAWTSKAEGIAVLLWSQVSQNEENQEQKVSQLLGVCSHLKITMNHWIYLQNSL